MERQVAPRQLAIMPSMMCLLLSRKGGEVLSPPPPSPPPPPPPSQKGRGKSLVVSEAALRSAGSRLFFFSILKVSPRVTLARERRAAINEGVKKVTSLFSIPLAGMRTAQVLREKADCSLSCSLRSLHDRNRVSLKPWLNEGGTN